MTYILPALDYTSRGAHQNGSSHGNGIPTGMGIGLNKDVNRNGNTITCKWERLMLVGTQNHSRRLVNSHYATLCALCLWLSHKGP